MIKIDFKKVEEEIRNRFNDIEISSVVDDELLSMYFEPIETTNIPFISVGINIYIEGYFSFTVSFGDINKSLKLYESINDFNENTIFHASIRETDLLYLLMIEVVHKSLKSEELIVDRVQFYFEELLFDDVTLKYLMPLIENSN